MRKHRIKRTSLRQWVVLVILGSLLPIAGFALIAFRVSHGDEEWARILPRGLFQNGPYLCVWIALLCVFVWVLIPYSVAVAKLLRIALAESARIRREGGLFARLREVLLWPPRIVCFWILYLVRGVCFIATFALLALIAVYITRLVLPDFLGSILPFPEDPSRLWPSGSGPAGGPGG